MSALALAGGVHCLMRPRQAKQTLYEDCFLLSAMQSLAERDAPVKLLHNKEFYWL